MNWALLLSILIQVESGGEKFPLTCVGDSGKALGQLQIHQCTVDEFNRVNRLGETFSHTDAFSNIKSRQMCVVVLSHYGKAYTKRTGREPTFEVLCRIWNGGYAGFFRNPSATDGYWEKCQIALVQKEK